jgi:hypothetical protein
MGPPGADQHLAGSSRAAGCDLTGRGMLTAEEALDRVWSVGMLGKG